MLRSLTDGIKRKSSPRVRLGLSVGRTILRCCELQQQADRLLCRSTREIVLAAPGRFTDGDSNLPAALNNITDGFRDRFVPIHISVPDPAVRFSIYEFDELPTAESDRNQLLEFRMTRDSGGVDMYCVSQVLGRSKEGKHLMLGVAMNAALRASISNAVVMAGIVPWSLSPNIVRYFNLLHDRLVSATGVLVTIDEDAWSLLAWDEQAFVRLIRTQWRTSDLTLDEVALDVERVVLAYVNKPEQPPIDRIWVIGGSETAALALALDARMKHLCEQVSIGDYSLHALPEDCPDQVFSQSYAAALQL